MMERRDYIALDWLVGEIATSLQQSVEALLAFQGSGDPQSLQRAAGPLHQVQGSLRMIEFSGAERLLAEMASCVEDMVSSNLDTDDTAQRLRVLLQLADELPAYLGRLRRARRELPASLMFMFNELRAACQQPLLSSSLLFAPQLDGLPAYSDALADVSDDHFRELAGKLLQMYRLALAAYRRDEQAEGNIDYLAKVAGRATRLCAETPQEDLWLAAMALLQGLANDSIAGGMAVDSLLSRLEQALALLAELGREAAARPLNHSLCKDILFYVACSPSDAPLIAQVQQRYGLDLVLADREWSSEAQWQQAQHRVIERLATALQQAAVRLRDETVQPGQLDLREIVDAVAVLGLSDALFALRALALHLGEALNAAQQEAVCGSLDHLAELLRSPPLTPPLFNNDPEAQLQLEDALRAVVLQSREMLADIQENLLSYVAEQFRRELVLAMPDQFRQLATGLSVAAFPGPAEILHRCAQYIEEQILAEAEQPSWAMLDALADAIAAVDYYLERSVVGPHPDDEGLLAVAEDCVQRLGYPVRDPRPLAPAAEVIPWPVADTDTPSGSETEPSAAEDDGAGLDPDILEVFLEEAGDVVALLEEKLPVWQWQLDAQSLLLEVRRAFHTLKGSGRMVGAEHIAELGWAMENMLNRVLDGHFQMDAQRFDLVQQGSRRLPELLAVLAEAGRAQRPAWLDSVLRRADTLATVQQAEFEDEVPMSDPGPGEAASAPPEDSLLGIFIIEADTHLQLLEGFLADIDSCPVQLSDEVQRSLHTLKGSSKMAEVWAIANLVTPLEALVKELRAMRVPADRALIDMMAEVVAYSRRLSDALRRQPVSSLRTPADLLHRLEALSSQLLNDAEISALQGRKGQLAPGVLNSFLAGFSEELQYAGDLLAAAPPPSAEQVQALAPGLGGFALRAEDINAEPIAELSQTLQVLFSHAHDPLTPAFVALASRALEQLMTQLNQIAAEQAPEENAELLTQIRDFKQQQSELVSASPVPEDSARQGVDSAADELGSAASGDQALAPAGRFTDAAPGQAESASSAPSPQPATPAPQLKVNPLDNSDSDVDQEILEIFLEEAGDLLDSLDQAIQAWSEQPGDDQQLDNLQRYLHTIKGGARLAGQAALGDLSHEFESAINAAQRAPQQDSAELLRSLHYYQDQMVAAVAEISLGVTAPPSADAAVETAVGFRVATDEAPEDSLLLDTELSADSSLARGPQEMIKVSAQLLERLINLAGETSIARARNEEQLSEVQLSLEEMEMTIERLHEQVRRMDMETEAQILFRQEQVGSEGSDGFDPLEFDRYSQLQQYSRSLLESASDLVDLRNTLLDKNRDMETLMLQQSRIHSDLQEGLMRSQMVHFSRMVPRLRRGVRQLSGELGKKVDFKVYNAEGEMDRRVLERIVPALEHMLRNAIGHGIEDEATRLAAGKPGNGEITMRFDRQGGDVVIVISDDGGGVDLAAVRAKAEALGLITPQAQLSERQLLEYIFHAGFSTATSLTQVSGRGVGMDMVRNEIKLLGGNIELRSEAGRGARFEVRLPFTVSVNRALMVSVAGEVFAVPLNNIEGIVRMSPYELEVYYQEAEAQFEYAGQGYNLRYMGQLMGHSSPQLQGQADLKPVLLIRNAEPATAVQVDSLLGSREVVVKTLGPQFAAVPGLSGATVLGDGSVVVILDMLASVRADAARRLLAGDQAALPTPPPAGNRLVMVVDDSVTVRKVTSRLLERQAMDVLLARDGLDAVTLLQDLERLPDVILLDIEMPRMDGFEVAMRLRGSPRTQHIPIIMISSRSGEKHRQRAASLGVSRFLSKPYQETQLLQAINEVEVLAHG